LSAGCFLVTACAAAPLQRDVKPPFYPVTGSQDGSMIEALSVDSLGHGEFPDEHTLCAGCENRRANRFNGKKLLSVPASFLAGISSFHLSRSK